MKHSTLILAFAVLLAGSLALAEEPSLLAQLQKETRALSNRASGAMVRLERAGNFVHTPTGVYAFPGPTATAQGQSRKVLRGWTHKNIGARSYAHAVLVGTPARIAIAYASIGDRAKTHAVLPDGSRFEVTRVFGDRELGVAVYDLPKEERSKWKGLAVVRDWEKVGQGSLVVGTGASGIVDLRTVHVADASLGVLTLGSKSNSGVVLGIDGSIAALRGDGSQPWNRSCEVCHRPNAVATAGLPVHRANGWTAYHQASQNFRYYSPTMITSGSGAVARAGVPGPVLARVLEDLEKHGRVRFGYLGVVLGDSGNSRGVRIGSVLDESPAASSGLRAGEWVAAIDGAAVRRSSTLSRAVLLRRPGATVKLTVVDASNKRRDLSVTLGDIASAQLNMNKPETLGFHVQEIGPELRAFLRLDNNASGVVVRECRTNSPAWRAGLRVGDVIYWGHDAPIANEDELYAAVASARRTVTLRYLRNGKEGQATIRITTNAKKTR